jgi:hypothetical protein
MSFPKHMSSVHHKCEQPKKKALHSQQTPQVHITLIPHIQQREEEGVKHMTKGFHPYLQYAVHSISTL